MRTLTISVETHMLMVGSTESEVDQNAKKNPDGTLSIEVEDRIGKRLDEMRFPGETDDELVSRVFSNTN